jgi:hypothetical protein
VTLWGIGCYEGPRGRVAWEISHEEMQRDMGAAARTLATLGIDSGRRVLFCSLLAEAGQLWPYVVGAMLNGAQLSCADATHGDAARVAMFTRLLDYHAVLGVDEAVLDGLDELERPYGEVFDGVAVLGARPGAYERLVAVGLAPHRFVLCGPAVAVGGEPGAPARVPEELWELGDEGDRITITARISRAHAFWATPTAVRGALVDGGVVPVPGRRPS